MQVYTNAIGPTKGAKERYIVFVQKDGDEAKWELHVSVCYCLFVIYFFERVEVLAAIQLMWTCYTHPPIYSQRTATTPGTSSPTLLE